MYVEQGIARVSRMWGRRFFFFSRELALPLLRERCLSGATELDSRHVLLYVIPGTCQCGDF